MNNFSIFDNSFSIDSPEGRKYKLPSGESFPSITTILQKDLSEWRKSVGEEKANEICKIAQDKGNYLHLNLENYLLQKEFDTSSKSVMLVKDVLDKHLTSWEVQEQVLFSKKLKVAGRTDLIGTFDRIPSVIDFKTSRKIKNRHEIPEYFIQTGFYGSCCYEFNLYFKPKQLVIIMISEEFPKPVIFKENILDWIKPMKDKICQYYSKN